MAEAIFSEPNNTIRFADVPPTGVTVQRGHTFDGLGTYYRETIIESDRSRSTWRRSCATRGRRPRVLPAGRLRAGREALRAGRDRRRRSAFVNCLPGLHRLRVGVGDASSATRALPIVGDDIKSQVGATIMHRVLTKLFEDRGVKLNRTYQLNFGGNMDFMNMLERKRLTSKKISKTQSVQSQLDAARWTRTDIHIGPSDYVPWLEDRKWAQIRLEGQSFGDVPLIIELKLEVWDTPNSAGIVIDAVRCVKLGARPRGRPAR